ncbi:MAG: DUF444 family protein [Bdellovibrionales bacterium]
MAVFLNRGITGRSLANRNRFERRMLPTLQRVWNENLVFETITDIRDETSILISGDLGNVHEPVFRRNGGTGVRNYVRPGNKHFISGEIIPRPDQAQKEAAAEKTRPRQSGPGLYISRGRLFDALLADICLPPPDSRPRITGEVLGHAGYSIVADRGPLSLPRTLRAAFMRRVAQGIFGEYTLRQGEIEVAREKQRLGEEIPLLGLDGSRIEERLRVIAQHETYIKEKRELRNKGVWIEKGDERVRLRDKNPGPQANAVLFVLMDGSSNFGESSRDIARRSSSIFFRLVKRHHREIDIVFINYGREATRVDEENRFFADISPGDARVFPAYETMLEIIRDRYGSQQCAYYGIHIGGAVVKDNDPGKLLSLMQHQIVPAFQQFVYFETQVSTASGASFSPIWNVMDGIKQSNFYKNVISNRREIIGAFRQHFPAPVQPQVMSYQANAPLLSG